MDIDKIHGRWRHVLSAKEGRPGQVWRSTVADEFDDFVVVLSVGCRGWQTAPDDVFGFLCFLLVLKGKALLITWCIKHIAPAWAMRATMRACRGLRALNGTWPGLFEKVCL